MSNVTVIGALRLSVICKEATVACGPGSSVSVATVYWLDGPESNPGGDDIFHTCPDRP